MAARRRGVRGFNGTLLRTARESRLMSRGDLGRVIGMPPSLVAAYEEGQRTPEWATLAAIADALESTVDELRPGQPTTMEELRCAAGQNQAAAAAAAGIGRSGYAMLENGHTRSLKPKIAQRLSDSWSVEAEAVNRAHAVAVREAGTQRPAALTLEGALLDGLAAHFGVHPDALVELARGIHDRTDGRTA